MYCRMMLLPEGFGDSFECDWLPRNTASLPNANFFIECGYVFECDCSIECAYFSNVTVSNKCVYSFECDRLPTSTATFSNVIISQVSRLIFLMWLFPNECGYFFDRD